MVEFFRFICSLMVVRYTTKFFLALGKGIGKIYSNLKYRALVEDCSNSMCHWSTQIKYGKNLSVGLNSRIGPSCTIGAKSKIYIGENVVISKNVEIETAGLDLSSPPPYNKHISKEIIIENGVWIGTHCIILGGVTIGENSIIGAGTVITKSLPANSIIVGGANRMLR